MRAVHAYPHTGSVVVWYSPKRCDRDEVLAAITSAEHVAAELIPARTPRSSDIRNTEVLRMVIGGAALALLGVRRYAFNRPPLLGPSGQLVATGATVFMGYPFLRGALRWLRSGRAGTDALVTAATVASLVLRENVVALTVLWLLNIGEYLQDLTLRRTRRAISDLLRGTADTAWILLTDGTDEVQVPIDTVQIGDDVVIHDHVAIPVDGDVVDGEAIVDQSAITGETLPVSIVAGARCTRVRWCCAAVWWFAPAPSATRPPSAASSPASKRHNTIGHRSRPSARTSPAASCRSRSSSPRSPWRSPATSGAR